MSDESIARRIEGLVAEEHELRTREQADSNDVEKLEDDQERLQVLEVELDLAARTCCGSVARCGTPAAIPTTRRPATGQPSSATSSNPLPQRSVGCALGARVGGGWAGAVTVGSGARGSRGVRWPSWEGRARDRARSPAGSHRDAPSERRA